MNKLEEKGRFKNTIFLKLSPQEVLDSLHALTIYKDYIVPKKYKALINAQLENINNQLSAQGINIYESSESSESEFGLGDICYINDIKDSMAVPVKKCIILGASEIENFIKIVYIENNDFKIDEVPVTMLSKIIK